MKIIGRVTSELVSERLFGECGVTPQRKIDGEIKLIGDNVHSFASNDSKWGVMTHLSYGVFICH